MTCNDPRPGPTAAVADRVTLATVAEAVRNGRTRVADEPGVQARHPERPAFHEGLIRIADETGCLIPAGAFIEAVETHELGRALDCTALEHGLEALRLNPGLRLSLNMSTRSIGHRRWTELLETGLERDPTAAERLILEITERSAILAPDTVGAFMRRYQAQGISFALDDFGAGYTSFRQFKELRFDLIKIDGAFCRRVHADADNQILVRALVSIGQHFDCFTVAEKIEEPEEARFLAQVGVDCLQGWLYGKPTVTPEWRDPAAELALPC